MKTFSSLSDFETYLKDRINSALQNEVAEFVEKSMKQNIQEEVYDSYSPALYHRRGELGRAVESFLLDDGELWTTTTSVSSPSVVHGGISIDYAKWINEGGVPNIFNNRIDYPWMYPRDFITPTIEDMSGGKVASVLKNAITK